MTIKAFIAGALLCGLCANQSVQAEPTTVSQSVAKLFVEDVFKSVELHHPELLKEIAKVEEARGGVVSAAGSYDPGIKSKGYSYLDGYYSGSSVDNRFEVPIEPAFGSVFARYRKGSGRLPVYEDENQTLSEGEAGFGVRFSVLRNLLDDERKLANDLASYDQKLAENSLGATKIALKKAAAERYWVWVGQTQVLSAFKKLLEVAEARQKQLEERQKAGDIAEFEVIDNRRSIFQRRAKIQKQEAIVAELAFDLSLFSRDGDGRPISPSKEQAPDKIPLVNGASDSLESLMLLASSTRPEIKRIETEIEKVRRENSFQKTRLLPDVEIEGSYSKDRGEGLATREGDESKIYVSVDIPIFQRKARGKMQELAAKESGYELSKRFFLEKLSADLSSYRVQLVQSAERFKVSLSELETTQQLENGELQKFESGDSNLLFLAIRELATAEAQIHVYEAQIENILYRQLLNISVGQL
jgi:outer membrane protein TolC